VIESSPHQAEVAAVREGALLLAPPLIDLEPLRVRGKDRVQWLNGMVTSDVAKLPVGAAQFSLHVGKTGKIVAELWIVHLESELVVAVPRGRAEELQAALDRYLIMENCEILAGQPDAAFLLAVGPGSARLVEMARAAGLDAGGAQRAGVPVGVVFGAPPALDAFVAASTASAAAPGEKVTLATEQGWDHARIRLGIGRFGVDFDGSAYPQEAALEVDAVSFSKGCYLGQEAVFMMQERGHPPRKLVRLEVEPTPDDPAEAIGAGTVVKAGDVEVGAVTSAIDGAVALATVKWKHAKAGTALTVGGRAATVA
jgi:folate-binding protein YgfZ